MNLEPRETAKALRMGGAFSDALEHRNPNAVLDYYVNNVNDRYIPNIGVEISMVRALADTYISNIDDPTVRREVEFGPFQLGHGYHELGYFDGIKHLEDGILLVENKLKTWMRDTDVEALAIDPQVSAYVHAIHLKYGMAYDKIKVEYHVSLKPALRQRKDESVANFATRVSEEVYENPLKYHRV